MADRQNCAGCYFSRAMHGGLLCKRNPPVNVPVMKRKSVLTTDPNESYEEGIGIQFPVVIDEEWCGEWKPRIRIEE